MLHEIHIQNYAVIDSLKVEFAAGLSLLSGETGSGKSILVDALGLVLGGRASVEVIRTGQERAQVTAVFRSEGTSALVGVAGRMRPRAGRARRVDTAAGNPGEW